MSKRGNAYRKAADSIEAMEDNYACYALHRAEHPKGGGPGKTEKMIKFEFMFHPSEWEQFNYGTSSCLWFGSADNPQNQLARQIALQLMAEMGY